MKAAIFIDGGYLRVLSRAAGHRYDPNFIERFACACVEPDEVLLRALYYDCAPFRGTLTLPVSGNERDYRGSDQWLNDLAAKPRFAVRRGVLKFRGFKPRRIPVALDSLTDDDFRPDFEQKGVDMRLGLDIASYAAARTVDRIILVTGDTDCLPAMKTARKAGCQVILIQTPAQRLPPELLWHADLCRDVLWPDAQASRTRKQHESRPVASGD